MAYHTGRGQKAVFLSIAHRPGGLAKEFRQLIGPSYIPPKWAFGLAQSRFGYKSEADIREVAAQYKANGLPLDMLGLRYALLPYLYSEFMKAALEDAPYFRPLAFDYPADPDAREVEDQLLLGEGLMIAPIYTQNAHGRTALSGLRTGRSAAVPPSGPHSAGGAACRQHFSAGRHRPHLLAFFAGRSACALPDVHR